MLYVFAHQLIFFIYLSLFVIFSNYLDNEKPYTNFVPRKKSAGQ